MKFSVVVPSLNQGQYIEACIQSILLQEHDNVQIIVVDGESNDQTQEVLNRYSMQIDTIICEPDDGQADALRKGFKIADGDIFCYLNSDDRFLPRAFESAEKFFEGHVEVDAFYCDRIFIDSDGSPIACWQLPKHVDYLMRRWDYIPQESCFWRKSLYEKSGGIDPSLEFAIDFDLFLKFMSIGKLVHRPTFNSAFRRHDAAKTSTLNSTVGKYEVAQLQRKYNIVMRPYDRVIGALLTSWIERRSAARFERDRTRLSELVK